jgi:hypothetical protein
VATDDILEPIPQVVEAIQHRQVALSRDSKNELRAVPSKGAREDTSSVARSRVGVCHNLAGNAPCAMAKPLSIGYVIDVLSRN